MKFYLIIFIVVGIIESSFSQSINNQNVRTEKPLWVLFSHNEIILKADTLKGFHNLPPKYIKSLNVQKDSIMLKKYGAAAKDGVLEVYLNDKEYPDAYDSLKKGNFRKMYHPTEQDLKKYNGKFRQ